MTKPFQYTDAHRSVLEHGPFWHFKSDQVSATQLAAEELFELGYVKLESYKWLDLFVVRYLPTKEGRAFVRAEKRRIEKRFTLLAQRMNERERERGISK